MIKLLEPATAVDAVADDSGQLILAIGTESGSIDIYVVSQAVEVKHVHKVDIRYVNRSSVLHEECLTPSSSSLAHAGPVNRLAWRRRDAQLQLASCSDDRSVRVFDVDPALPE